MMDREMFDALARLVATRQSRRAALAALLATGLTGGLGAGTDARKRRGGKVRARAKVQAKAAARRCFPGGTACVPGRGRNASGCDFTASTALFQGDFRGSNLSHSNFSGAQMAQADFRGANLSGACFVKANLRDAKLGASVNLDKAIFCRTLMPDGSLNDRDCAKGTACCPTPTVCEGEACGPDDCVPNSDICTLLWFGNPCCSDQVCTTGIVPLVTTCQLPCSTQQQCRDLDPSGRLVCANDALGCTYIGTCCTQKECDSDADCPSPSTCCGAICCFEN
jgi:hypothetical protein